MRLRWIVYILLAATFYTATLACITFMVLAWTHYRGEGVWHWLIFGGMNCAIGLAFMCLAIEDGSRWIVDEFRRMLEIERKANEQIKHKQQFEQGRRKVG